VEDSNVSEGYFNRLLGMRLKIGTVDSEDDSTGRGGSIFITDGEKGGGQ